jgi:hypothetical protein
MKYKIKLICGYDQEQHHEIDAQEAHKAYYLFNNPDKRGTFNNGISIIGKEIKVIQPDYHATMGWNKTYALTDEDLNILKAQGVIEKMKEILGNAKDIARSIDERPELANIRLGDILIERHKEYIVMPEVENLGQQFKISGL